MKPYVVEYVVRAVVMAEDSTHAHQVAEDQWRDIRGDERPDIDVEHEVHESWQLPTGWDLECLPYGGDGNTRLAEIVAGL